MTALLIAYPFIVWEKKKDDLDLGLSLSNYSNPTSPPPHPTGERVMPDSFISIFCFIHNIVTICQITIHTVYLLHVVYNLNAMLHMRAECT